MTNEEDECELGYWLGVSYWGHGLMPEAVFEILRHAFENLDVLQMRETRTGHVNCMTKEEWAAQRNK